MIIGAGIGLGCGFLLLLWLVATFGPLILGLIGSGLFGLLAWGGWSGRALALTVIAALVYCQTVGL